LATVASACTAHAIASGPTVVAVTAPLIGLSPGATYYFRVVAASAGGTTDSTILSFATLAPPTATTQAATAVSSTTATLNAGVNRPEDRRAGTYVYGTGAT